MADFDQLLADPAARGKKWAVSCDSAMWAVLASSNRKMVGPVLIVDDDQETLLMVDALIRASGYTTVLARNGRDALARARDCGPSVIVLDLMMPVMDGVQFCQAQKEDPSIAAIPVVLCSAHPRARQVGREVGAAGVFQKAGDLDHLIELVDKHSSPQGLSPQGARMTHETAVPEEVAAATREGDAPDRRPLVMWQARHDNGWRTVLLEQPDGAFVAYAGIDRTIVLNRVDSLERARETALAALRSETGHDQCSFACSEWAITVTRRGTNP